MQLRGMSWRVLRCFKTSVVNVLRLLRPLILRIHQSKYNFLSGIEWGKRWWPQLRKVHRWKAVSRPVKLQKRPLNCMVLRNVMASLSLFVIERHSRVWLLRLQSLCLARKQSSNSATGCDVINRIIDIRNFAKLWGPLWAHQGCSSWKRVSEVRNFSRTLL